MNIIYLVHQFYPECWTGTEKFVFKISSALQKTGQRVKVITYSFYDNSFFDKKFGDILYKEFVYKGLPVLAFKNEIIDPEVHISIGERSMYNFARMVLEKEKPDLIHVGHPMRINDFIFCARNLNISYLITLTDFWLLCPSGILLDAQGNICEGPNNGTTCRKNCPNFSSRFIENRLEAARELLFGASKVVSPSNFLAHLFKKELENLPVYIISHGMSYKTIKKNDKKYKKGDKIIFCYAGSLNRHKGVDFLIEALKKIESDKFILKIYGSGWDKEYLNKLYDMTKEDTRFEFHGVYDENKVGEVLSDIDVVIVPSIWYENYPLILHEALACGVPVVASNIGGMAEKIKDNINGFTFPAGNTEALNRILKNILNDPCILNGLKENINKMFIPTVEQEALSYYESYVNILYNE